jgi:hypothetical protein
MDPSANIEEQLRIASRLVRQSDEDKPFRQVDVARLAELVIALDEWIVNGGFVPRRWTKGQE